MSIPQRSTRFSTSVKELLQAIESDTQDKDTLSPLLSEPLYLLGITSRETKSNAHTSSQDVCHDLPRIQHAILTRLVPIWADVFEEAGQISSLQGYFCPDYPLLPLQNLTAVFAYPSLTAVPFGRFSLGVLHRLITHFNIDVCYSTIFDADDIPSQKKTLIWEDCVRTILSRPTRLANQSFLKELDT